jgi:hypothetical protein
MPQEGEFCTRHKCLEDAAYKPYFVLMPPSLQSLLTVAAVYENETAAWGGKSLARVTTLVLNTGSFFNRLRSGGDCSVRSFDKVFEYLSHPEHWPRSHIPASVAPLLACRDRRVPDTGDAE